MKKLILALGATLFLSAADHSLYNYSLSFVGGYAVNSSESNLDNDFTWGFRYNYNRETVENSIDLDVIQFAFDHSGNTLYQDPAHNIVDGETDIYRFGLNALWYIENDSDFTPFVLAGVGVQFFGDEAASDQNNALFATVGAGVEYQLRGDFSVFGEVKGMFAGDSTNYVSGNIGIKYSFGQNYQSSAPAVRYSTVVR